MWTPRFQVPALCVPRSGRRPNRRFILLGEISATTIQSRWPPAGPTTHHLLGLRPKQVLEEVEGLPKYLSSKSNHWWKTNGSQLVEYLPALSLLFASFPLHHKYVYGDVTITASRQWPGLSAWASGLQIYSPPSWPWQSHPLR